jgi:hypothetical protein
MASVRQGVDTTVGAATETAPGEAANLSALFEPACGCKDLLSTESQIVSDAVIAYGSRRSPSDERLYSIL